MKSQPKRKLERRITGKTKEEAERLHELATYEHDLAGLLTWRFASKIQDEVTRGSARMDFDMIVHYLAPGDPETRDPVSQWPTKGMWQRFKHHFANPKAQRAFFSAIDAFAIRYWADLILAHAIARLEGDPVQSPDLSWDEKLLPLGTVPYLLRQWTRDKKLTREFLIALFKHYKKGAEKGSVPRRAVLTSQFATLVGFKPAAQTDRLIKTGDIQLGQHETDQDQKLAFDRQAATIGRSIRRLRAKGKASLPRRRRP